MPLNDSLKLNEPSVFSGHLLTPFHTDPVFRAGTTYYWPGIILFLVLILYVSIKVYDPKKILKIFASVFSLQASKQLFREDYKLTKRVSVFLTISFVLVISFLIHITNHYFGFILSGVSPLKQYGFFLVVVCLVYSAKFLSSYLLSYVVSNTELDREYFFNIFVFSQTLGVILFPMIILIQFSKYPAEWFLYPAVIICGGFYVLRLFRGFVISVLEQNIGILYIFLYLCALEILPLLVLVKFLLTTFK